MPVPSKFKILCAAVGFMGILVGILMLVFWLPAYRNSEELIETAEGKAYLMKFGYLSEGANSTSEEVSRAMKVFQLMAGLIPTGVLNYETLKKMRLPRCGMVFQNRTTKKGVDEVARWPQKNLTYSITKYPASSLTVKEVDAEIERAFAVWSDHTDLNFRKLDGRDYRVDIEIRFEVGEHRDGVKNQFDGPGGILAHAFFPQNGRTHFDDTEEWTVYSDNGTNLFQVAAHEFGHALGLDHSQNPDALMAPMYNGYQEDFSLHDDDITQIQSLYGKKTICENIKYDTVFTDRLNVTYVLMGSQYWELGRAGHPRDVQRKWTGLPPRVDAAFSHRQIGKTYFFSGGNVWRFQADKLDKGYPKKISERFPKIPNNLDAAFVWPLNQHIYFFKGSDYWKFDYTTFPPVTRSYPRKIGAWWRGAPDAPDAAFNRGDATYFAKGGSYAQFNDGAKEVVSNGEQSISVLLGCVTAENFDLHPPNFNGQEWIVSRYEKRVEESIVAPEFSCPDHSACIIP